MSEKKQIPTALGKQQFAELFKPIGKATVLHRLNEIIFEFRKGFPENQGKPKSKIIACKSATRSEMLEYCRTYNFPAEFVEE